MSLLKEVRLDNTEKVLEILQTQQDLNQIDPKSGNSLLHFAIINQNPVILRELIQCKNALLPINLNIVNTKDGQIPIIAALNLNFVQGVQLLLQYKVDPNTRLEDGRSILHYAVAVNQTDILQILIKFGAKINAIASCGTPLHVSISENQNENALFLLSQKGITLDETDDEGDNVFHLCAFEGQGDVLNQIIQLFSESDKHSYVKTLVNNLNKDGNTPIHVAAIHERSVIVSLFESNAELLGLDLTIKNKAGLTYSQIRADIQMKKEIEKNEIIQRKKQAQEDKSRKQQQRRQEVIEQNLKEDEDRKKQKDLKQKASEDLEKTNNTQKIYGVIILVFVLLVMYFAFNVAIGKKTKNLDDWE